MQTIDQLFALAQRSHQAGDLREAEAIYRQILATNGAFAAAWHGLGTLALACGKKPEAVELIERAVALAPKSALARFDLGVVYESVGNLEKAVANFDAAVRLTAGLPQAHYNLAVCYQRLGNLAAAQEHCSLALRQKSDYADAWNHQALLWIVARRLDEALSAADTAIRLDPNHGSAHNHRAVALQLLGRKEEAVEAYQRALSINPKFAHAHSNLAALLQDLGRLDEAEDHLRLAVELNPGFAVGWTNLAGVLQLQGKIDEATVKFRQAVLLAPADSTLRSNYLFCLNYDGKVDSATMLAEHRQWGSLFGQGVADVSFPALDRDPHRPLRIGYVSSDFYNHPVTRFFEPALENHNPDEAVAICYANVIRPDETTARLQSLADEWRPIHALSDADVAKQIRDDRIDILVDLSGHTAASRLTVFAQKPAPIQVAWLGYPTTTGLAAMDYFLTDAIVDPPGAEERYVERLIRLPYGFACYAPAPDAPPVNALPADGHGFVTFGSLHGIARLNHDVIDMWCTILRAIPSAHLLIFRNTLQGRVRDELFRYIVGEGIAPGRFELRHTVEGLGGYRGVYHDIDVSLDTFPWSGHTTACQSLWMGVPVITLAGTRHAGRMAASVLHQMGLDEWIAESRERYVEIAVKAAADIGALAVMRQSLRERMARSPVCDGKTFAASLEWAYREMWREWCALQ